tara:strand:+ start:196 stop:828 length:633 start_codon:yes stop_codon:yes gene_type:complete
MDYKKKYLKYKIKYLIKKYQQGGKQKKSNKKNKQNKQNNNKNKIKTKKPRSFGPVVDNFKLSIDKKIDRILENYIKNDTHKQEILKLSEPLDKYYEGLENKDGKYNWLEVFMTIPLKITKVLVDMVGISKESLSNNIFELTKFKSSTEEEQKSSRTVILNLINNIDILLKEIDVELDGELELGTKKKVDLILKQLMNKLDELNSFYNKFS